MTGRLVRLLGFLGRALAVVAAMIVCVAIAKVLQAIAVDHLGDRLGFDLASLVGVAPFILLLLYLAHRFPRRARPRSGG